MVLIYVALFKIPKVLFIEPITLLHHVLHCELHVKTQLP